MWCIILFWKAFMLGLTYILFKRFLFLRILLMLKRVRLTYFGYEKKNYMILHWENVVLKIHEVKIDNEIHHLRPNDVNKNKLLYNHQKRVKSKVFEQNINLKLSGVNSVGLTCVEICWVSTSCPLSLHFPFSCSFCRSFFCSSSRSFGSIGWVGLYINHFIHQMSCVCSLC